MELTCFRHLIIIFFIFLTFINFSFANECFIPEKVKNVTVRIDGILDEDIWKTIPAINTWYQLKPNEGKEPSESTEMWLFYDQDALYLGARLHVSQQEDIIARTMERDSYSPDQDAVALIIDTLNDNRTAYGFIVSPAGVRTDIAIFDDAENVSSPWNIDWNSFWEANSSCNSNNWCVEVRIPFSSLRYKDNNGSVSMGIILWRYLASKKEFDVFPNIPNKWHYSAYKPSQALDVNFEGIKELHPIYIRPYIIAGVEHSKVIFTEYAVRTEQNQLRKDVGIDIKYNLTNNWVLDATLNPDFAQVEDDNYQINLTRFSLYLPEKRPFFQERSDLFDFRIPGGSHRIFYSRSIGIADGQNVPIIGGIRLTGRISKWEIGLIEMRTTSKEINSARFPSENFGVFRLKSIVKDDGSYIGGMVTSKINSKGVYNFVVAGDIDLSIKKPFFLKMKLVESTESHNKWDKNLLGALVLHTRKRKGFSFGSSIVHIGKDFNPRMGFIPRRGINRIGQRLGYFWFPKTSSFLQSYGFTNRLEWIWNVGSGRIETFQNRLDWEFILRSGDIAVVDYKFTRENLLSSFWIGKVRIDEGNYQFSSLNLRYHSSSGSPFQLSGEILGGGYYGGWQKGFVFSPSFTFNSNLNIQMEYKFNKAEVKNGIYKAHLARLRVRYALNKTLTSSVFI